MNGNKGVGTYILNSATTGAPSETGTWVAKGTATDTRHTTTDTDYTQDFVGTFEQDLWVHLLVHLSEKRVVQLTCEFQLTMCSTNYAFQLTMQAQLTMRSKYK